MPRERSPVYSVIIPVFNEEQVAGTCYKELTKVMEKTEEPYELIFVNDGSRDKTLAVLHGIASADPRVRILNFSRNFGHQIAITAGLDHASGEAMIIIDADLQDPPPVIREFIKKWKQGFDVVYGKRNRRKSDSLFKRLSAALFYRLLGSLSATGIPPDVGDFRLIDKAVCEALKKMPERHRFLRGLVSWSGFRQTPVEYERRKRLAGKTKYPLLKMINFAMDAITSFSHKPLKIAIWIGFITSAAGFLYLVYSLIRFASGATSEGWTSIVSLLIIFNGILFIMLGIIGQYVGRIYDEVKGRPLYIVRDTIGFDSSKKRSREHERRKKQR